MEPRRPFVNDRYEFLRLLATGGMGQVWCARDTLLQRDVAVKVLRSEFTGNPYFLARFRAEAQHTAALAHPNIATLYDYGEVVPEPGGSGEHVAFLVMELVDGEPLSAVLAREGRLPTSRTLSLLRQAAAGLAAAHAGGVVHRDVKPANVLVGPGDIVKITDFGIASSTASVPLTQTGQVIGTAHYLSPEQAQGARATPASDVYALGMVAYECLAGRRAFDGESSVQIALRHIREQPPPLPDDVPENVRCLVQRALVKVPDLRLPDGAAFRDAVDAVLAGRAVEPPPAPSSTAPIALVDVDGALPAVPAPRRRPRTRVSARLAVALLAVLAAAAGAFWLADGSTEPRVAAAADPTTPSSAAPRTVAVVAGDYVGRQLAEVEGALTQLGLRVQVRTITTADLPEGQVIAVDPAGALSPGAVVTVTVAVAPAPAPGTVPAPAPASAGTIQVSVQGGVPVTSDAGPAVAAPTQDGGPASPQPPGQAGGKGRGNAKGHPGG